MPTYTAVIKHNAQWRIGRVAEVPGVNAQAATRDELLDDLRSALSEAIGFNRGDARRAAVADYQTVTLHDSQGRPGSGREYPGR